MLTERFDCQHLIFSGHALKRMFFRGISERDVEVAIAHGEMIESYPDDQPFPSMLILDFVRGMALHIVISQDPGSESCTVVTAYIPDKTQWMASFKTRR